jgi:hypothetical protein
LFACLLAASLAPLGIASLQASTKHIVGYPIVFCKQKIGNLDRILKIIEK